MYQLFKMVSRDFMNLFTNPTWLIFSLGFPFALVSIIGFMTSSLYSTSFSSYDYYGVTLMIFAVLYTGTFAANNFMEEKIKKANLRILYMTVSEWMIPLSKAIASFLYTLNFYTIISIILACLYHVNYGSQFLKLWLLFANINFLSSYFGILFCCLFKSESVANQVMSIITNLLAITSGLLFSISSLGSLLEKISQFSPLYYVVKVAFELIYDGTSSCFNTVMLVIFILSGILILVSQRLFKGEDYL